MSFNKLLCIICFGKPVFFPSFKSWIFWYTINRIFSLHTCNRSSFFMHELRFFIRARTYSGWGTGCLFKWWITLCISSITKCIFWIFMFRWLMWSIIYRSWYILIRFSFSSKSSFHSNFSGLWSSSSF